MAYIGERLGMPALPAIDVDSPVTAAGQGLASPSCCASFGVIYADPPWRYDFAQANSRSIENQYPTMSDEEICAMEIPAAKDAILYLWTVAPRLPAGMAIMQAWGFQYKTCAVWDKVKVGMGYWFRGQHEILMVGTRGNVSPPPQSLRISSVIRCPRGRHSAKPDIVRDKIAEWYPDVPKLEMFSRLKRPGWEVFGNQVEYDLLSNADSLRHNEKGQPQPPRASVADTKNL
jgi:N6-adenosine-specific RNA methylase IME4